VIAIDGPAGAGKSTIAKLLATRVGVEYLDTGAMYRAVTFAVLESGADLHDDDAVAAAAAAMQLDLDGGRVLVNGADATAAIRGPEVTAAVSAVSAVPAVRRELQARQRAWALARGGGVLEGRDIGTVVFPDALVKVFLTASAAERARRRHAEVGGDVDAIEAAIRERDHKDASRADSPMAEAGDAVVVDTTGLTIDEVLDRLVAVVEEREQARQAGEDGP
jgi:cytidylate kinase